MSRILYGKGVASNEIQSYHNILITIKGRTMPLAYNLEFLLPLLIGIGCLIFSLRIVFRNSNKDLSEAQASPQALHFKESGNDDDYDDDSLMRPPEEKLEPGRKVFYFLLFAGLGIASIVFGLAAIHPVLSYVAKGIIVLTIIASIIANARVDRKLAHQQTLEAEKSLEENAPDNQ